MTYSHALPTGFRARGVGLLVGIPHFGRRTPLTMAYLATLTLVGALLASLGGHWQARVVGVASTNLQNLSEWHLSTFATSAFVIDDGPVWFACLGVGCTLALAEMAWGARRVLTTFVLGHVGATAAVAIGLWVGIGAGWLPLGWGFASDVGVSYGVVAVLSGLAFSLPRGWRLPWATVWVAVAAQAVISERSFTSVGHCIATIVGLGVAWLVLRHRGGEFGVQLRSPLAIILLIGAAGFGMLIVGWGIPGWWTAPVVAVVAALAAKSHPMQAGLMHLSCGPRPRDASPATPTAWAAAARLAPKRRPDPA